MIGKLNILEFCLVILPNNHIKMKSKFPKQYFSSYLKIPGCIILPYKLEKTAHVKSFNCFFKLKLPLYHATSRPFALLLQYIHSIRWVYFKTFPTNKQYLFEHIKLWQTLWKYNLIFQLWLQQNNVSEEFWKTILIISPR